MAMSKEVFMARLKKLVLQPEPANAAAHKVEELSQRRLRLIREQEVKTRKAQDRKRKRGGWHREEGLSGVEAAEILAEEELCIQNGLDEDDLGRAQKKRIADLQKKTEKAKKKAASAVLTLDERNAQALRDKIARTRKRLSEYKQQYPTPLPTPTVAKLADMIAEDEAKLDELSTKVRATKKEQQLERQAMRPNRKASKKAGAKVASIRFEARKKEQPFTPTLLVGLPWPDQVRGVMDIIDQLSPPEARDKNTVLNFEMNTTYHVNRDAKDPIAQNAITTGIFDTSCDPGPLAGLHYGKYDFDRFGAVSVPMPDGGTVLAFEGGKSTNAGDVSYPDSLLSTHRLMMAIERFPENFAKPCNLLRFKMTNRVFSCKLGYRLDLKKMAAYFGKVANYDTDKISALFLTLEPMHELTLSCFHSGRINILRATRHSYVQDAKIFIQMVMPSFIDSRDRGMLIPEPQYAIEGEGEREGEGEDD